MPKQFSNLVASLLAALGLGVAATGGWDDEGVKTDAALVVAVAHLAEQVVPDPAPAPEPAKDEQPAPEPQASPSPTPKAKEKTPVELRVEEGRAIVFRMKAECVVCDQVQQQITVRMVPQGWTAGTTDDVDWQFVNAEERADLVRRYSITKCPTVIIVRGDQEVSRIVGYADANRLADWLIQHRKTK